MISVGVDIGAYSIKVADIEPTSRSYVIRRIQEFPLSLDLTKDRKIEIIDTLRTLFSQYDLNNTQFVFGVSQKAVTARLLNFPFRERFKIQKAVISLLEDELPFSHEDAVFDAKVVRYLGKGADVLALAVPKDVVRDILNLAHDCGVEPALISSESLGLSNHFERWDDAPPEAPALAQDMPTARAAEMVINIGHTSSELLVYAERELLAVRNIDWGGRNIADAIGQKYGLNYLQAMRELQTKGFILLDKGQGTREQIAFSEVIEGAVQGLVSDLRLKMLELQSDMHLQWAKGHIMGGTAQLKNLGGYLTQNFQMPFNKFKQFEHQPSLTFEFNSHQELATAVAVGLAIEGLKKPRNPATNFLKDEFAQQGHFFEALKERWGYTLGLLGAAFVVLMVYGMMRSSATFSMLEESDKVLRRQAEAIARLKGSQASSSRIRAFINAQDKMEKSRKQAEKVVRLNSAIDVLELISSSVPPKDSVKFEIKRVNIQNDQAEVHGYAYSQTDIREIEKALQRAAAGKTEVIPKSEINIPPGRIGFSYRFKVNRYSGG